MLLNAYWAVQTLSGSLCTQVIMYLDKTKVCPDTMTGVQAFYLGYSYTL